MALITVEATLDEFDDEELINEIAHRVKRKRKSKDQADFIRAIDRATRGDSNKGNTLEDAIKQEMFEKHMRRISINYLDQFLGGL